MKGFYITVKNGLLDPKHVKAMGGDRNVGTIWLFMWLLDKMTIINDEIGEGKVLGGKPIKYEEVKEDLGMSRRTYIRWIEMLRDGGYIKTDRTPYGLKITVFKAFKVFNQRSASKGTSNVRPKAHQNNVGGTSNIRQDSRQDRKTASSKKKPYYGKLEMRKVKGKWFVIPVDNSSWLEFNDHKSKIIWR